MDSYDFLQGGRGTAAALARFVLVLFVIACVLVLFIRRFGEVSRGEVLGENQGLYWFSPAGQCCQA